METDNNNNNNLPIKKQTYDVLEGKVLKIQVNENSFVELCDVMPRIVEVGRTADNQIVKAARTSTGNAEKSLTEDETLLRYLKRNRHSSPEEMAEAQFLIQCTIVDARQILRHRTANVNEYSLRYSEALDFFYVPDENHICKQTIANKQGSDEKVDPEIAKEFQQRLKQHFDKGYENYKWALDKGIARETSRYFMPVASYTRFYFKMDLRNLFHFLSLRMDKHAQKEIREIADAMYELIKPVFPMSCKAFEHYQFESMQLTQLDITSIQSKKSDLIGTKNKRENSEYVEKCKILGLKYEDEKQSKESKLI